MQRSRGCCGHSLGARLLFLCELILPWGGPGPPHQAARWGEVDFAAFACFCNEMQNKQTTKTKQSQLFWQAAGRELCFLGFPPQNSRSITCVSGSMGACTGGLGAKYIWFCVLRHTHELGKAGRCTTRARHVQL